MNSFSTQCKFFVLFCSFFIFHSVDLCSVDQPNKIKKNHKDIPKKVPADSSDYIIIRQPDYISFLKQDNIIRYPGMFSVFNTVVGCLDDYEKGSYQGISVNFLDKGLYYDPSKGQNWWSYYCEPIEIINGPYSHPRVFKWGDECFNRAMYTELRLSKERVHELVSRYIKFKPLVLDIVDEFREKYFSSSHTIGIHYRGTDKANEAIHVPYEEVFLKVQDYIQEKELSDFVVFIATDEADFIDFMIKKFPNQVAFTDSLRSTDGTPLHYQLKDPYRQGLETVVDCILLSQTDVLFRTSSNLSLWSTYLNPELTVIPLSVRLRVIIP